MRKLTLSLAAMALFFAGCQKPELVEPAADNLSFEATVEEFEGQTKTSLSSGNYVVWSADDRLAIFQGSSIADEYQIAEESAGTNSGVFKLAADNSEVNGDFNAGTELSCNVAFYPYSKGLNLTGDMEGKKASYVISNAVLPAMQTYVANSFANGAFPMIAVTTSMKDHDLMFKNVLGAVKLSFKGTQIVKSITVEGLNGEKLSGAATVTAYSNNLNPAIQMLAGASSVVTLDCGDDVQLSESEATDFYVALPPVLFEKGFKVTITDAADQEYTMVAQENSVVLRSSILVMPEQTLEAKEDDTPSDKSRDYVDEYGINHGPGVEIDGVVWAPVNCGYHAEDYKWGKLYQWGRKYGQGYSGKLYDGDYNFIGSVSDATTPEISEGGVSLQGGQSENNKNVFYISPDSPHDWLYQQNGALWNSGTVESPVKTEYDPCPEGWRVPTYNELLELRQNHSSWTTNELGQSGYWFSGASPYTESAAKVFFPAAGGRSYNDGDADNRGGSGYYWSSRPGYGGFAYYLGFCNGVAGVYDYNRAYGYSVRCVQD